MKTTHEDIEVMISNAVEEILLSVADAEEFSMEWITVAQATRLGELIDEMEIVVRDMLECRCSCRSESRDGKRAEQMSGYINYVKLHKIMR